MHRLTVGILGTVFTASVTRCDCPAPTAAAGRPLRRRSRPRTPPPASSHSAESTALVARYCASCHSDRGKSGGLSLAAFDAAKAEETPDVAEKMIRKLRAGMMPPPGAKRPDAAALPGLASALEHQIDQAWAAQSQPGTASVSAAESRRISRARSTTCSASTSTSPRSCRPTRAATASTTSPTCRPRRRR